MSNQAHVIKIKDNAGNWVDIPVSYTDVYQSYVSYCLAHGDDPLSQAAFYNTFKVFSDSAFLQTLIEAVGTTGALPIDNGGTGATTPAGAQAALDIYTKTQAAERKAEIDETLNTINTKHSNHEERIIDLETKKDPTLTTLGITIGSGEPTEYTKGTIYFRID